MSHLVLGRCGECSRFVLDCFVETDEAFTSPVAQRLGAHWYEEHSRRHKLDFVIARQRIDVDCVVLTIGTKVRLYRFNRFDDEAKKWALSFIEVCEHHDGITKEE